MDDRKFEIIQELMAELEGLMGHGPDELGERLGRPKPEVSVEIESAEEMPMDEMAEDEMMEAPGDKLKSRLMKLRG